MVPVPPPQAFTAVIYDVEDRNKDLTEPLIESETAKPTRPLLAPTSLKLASLLTGSLSAIISQLLLSQLLWMPNILHQSTSEIVWFSLQWSFWTCLTIFGTMLLLVRCFDEDDDDILFQMEAHHIVGALLSISGIWIVLDIAQSVPAHSSVPNTMVPSYQNALYVAVAVAWYALLLRCYWQRRHATEQDNTAVAFPMLPTYTLIAGTLGLISGLCSQFLLSFLLWQDHMSAPIISNVLGFSLLWSACTVFLTFWGCASLRILVTDEDDRIMVERIFLRMESHYVFCSLVGICVAWILIDLVMDMKEQILPSIVMLGVSLGAFGAILRCFPEEECLKELEEEANDQV